MTTEQVAPKADWRTKAARANRSGVDMSAEKKTYSKITFDGGDWCVCEPKDVAQMTQGEKGFTVAEVQMTEAEFEALPEFNG